MRCLIKYWNCVLEFEFRSEKGGVGLGLGRRGLALKEVPELHRATEDISLNYSQVLSFNFLSL
jgi:hypothetical protein